MLPLLLALAQVNPGPSSLAPIQQPTRKFPSFINVSKPGKDGWKPSKVTPEAFARRYDDALKGAKGVSARTNSMFDFGVGTGDSSGSIAILDSKHFRIEYPYVPNGIRQQFEKQSLVAGGGRFGIMTTAGWRQKSLFDKRKSLLPSPAFDAWSINGTRYLFAGIGMPDRPVGQLVAEARRRGSGISVRVEERTARQVTVRRLLLSRGSRTVEISVEAKSSFPTTFRVTGLDSTNHPFRAIFAMRWDFSSGQRFDPEIFSMPK